MADAVPDSPSSTAPAGEQRVAWVELFFDLILVFAVTQIAAALAKAHDLGEAAQLLLLLVALWYGWVGTAILGNAAGAGMDAVRSRLAIFALGACALLMAVTVPTAYGDGGLVFAIGFVGLRLLLWRRVTQTPLYGGRRVQPFSIGLFVSGPLVLAGGLVTGPSRTVLWAAAVAVQVLAPVVLGKRLHSLHFETSHLPERFGLFILIVLGETVVALGGTASSAPLNGTNLATLAVGYVVIAGLWWTYFHYGASAARYSLESRGARVVRDVFNYGHLIYVVAILLVAVGLKKLVAHPLDLPHSLPEFLLAPGAALYLFGFCFSRWRMFGAALLPRFLAAWSCVVLALLAPLLPGLATAVLVAVVIVAVNAVELWLVETGRHVPVVHFRRTRV